jgi:glycine/D-amino acid oxidase-like deaminating enzyme
MHRAGVFDRSAALVQPAALCRGLRRAALALGVRIAERSPVRRFTRTSPIRVECGSGARVLTDRLLIATNAWAAGIRELRGAIAVISSVMIVTEPVPESLAPTLWPDDLALTDSQTMVDYYRLTADRRIAFGKGGWTIALGARIGPRFDRHPGRAALVEGDFRRYYPALASVPVAAAWSGPIDRTQDSLPLLGRLGGRENIFYGVGWSGNGVGPSVLGGKILASLVLGRADEWSRHPLVDRRSRRFPPEPIRFIGAHVVRTAVAAKERAEARNAKPPRWAVALARLAPAGLEDKD